MVIRVEAHTCLPLCHVACTEALSITSLVIAAPGHRTLLTVLGNRSPRAFAGGWQHCPQQRNFSGSLSKGPHRVHTTLLVEQISNGITV